LGCAALSPPVSRSVDGVTTEGRFIEPDAYAMYAVGALREARGQWREALELYERALDLDHHGPEIRTRIGAVACKLREHGRAEKSFEAARSADPEYGPLWYEVALCHKSRAQLVEAERAALEAVRLDPERYEASLLAADIAEQLGDTKTAWRLRDALATHAPRSLAVQRSLLDAARRAGDVARITRAEQALAAIAHPEPPARPGAGVTAALEALGRGDVAAAQRAAELALGADPSNGDALVVALFAADLQQDHDAFARLLQAADEPGKPASSEVLGMLESLLARKVSAQAAQLVRPQP
jgi:Tfp pilus assembly protein PilF